MDIVTRLILLSAWSVLCLFSRPVLAYESITPIVTTIYTCTYSNGSFSNSSYSVACTAAAAGTSSDNGYTFTTSLVSCNPPVPDVIGAVCRFKISGSYAPPGGGAGGFNYNDSFFNLTASQLTALGCGENSINVGSAQSPKCACPAEYLPSSGKTACQRYTCGIAGEYSAVTQPDQLVPNAGDSICDKGCSFKPSSWKAGADGKIWATWPFRTSGSFCAGDPKAGDPLITTGQANTANPAPLPCGANSCPGNVNGASVCVACKSQETAGPSSASSAPGGASAPDLPNAPPGTKSQDQSTACTGLSCTTTTVYKDAAGAEIGRKSDEKPQLSFCKENPESPLCKQSGFGGTCGAFTCDGDAIQCAVARQVKQSACDLDTGVELQNKGFAAVAGGDRPGDHPWNSPDSNAIAFSSAISTADGLGGGCPVDVTIAYGSSSVVIPWSNYCSALQLIGNLAVACCMLAAAFIVFRN